MLPAASRDDDATLVARLRAGDAAAFDAMVVRHRPRLLAHARRILGDRRDQADDVVQEALLRAHRALLRDDREMRLVPWLLKLTRNCALDELARVRVDSVPLDAPAAEAGLGSEALEPGAVAERRASVRVLLADIACLPSQQRHALLRRELDGASHLEVAAELGITAQASRSLVLRARDNLARQGGARDARCSEVQDELLRASRTGRRASGHAHRHLVTCAGCRAYRARLRAMRRAMHLLHPGPALVLGVAAAKAGSLLGGGGGAAAGGSAVVAKAPAGGLVAALAATAAAGSVVLAGAGDPSPVGLRSAVLPGGAVREGQPLPPNTAIVARLTVPGRTATLSCPPGMRVADLLPPDGGRVSAGYVRGTVPGWSRTARVAVAGAGSSRSVGLAVLCRHPDGRGSLVPSSRAAAAGPGSTAAVCARHVYLRHTPRGGTTGSARLGQPVRVVGRQGRWRRVTTDLGTTGWLPADRVCVRRP